MKLENVLDIIDKHIAYHDVMIEQCKVKIRLAQVMDRDGTAYLQEINDSCCAIAGLEMLKSELTGEKEY